MKINSPILSLNACNRKIHWVWFDAYSDCFLISNLEGIWALNLSLEKFNHIYSNSENAEEGHSEFSRESLMNLVSEKVMGFDFSHLDTYLENDEPVGDIFMLLKGAICSGLSGELSVCHPCSVSNNLYFQNDLFFFNGKKNKLNSHTNVHRAHPLNFSFFTGDNVGCVYWHKCDDSGVLDSIELIKMNYPIKDIVISENGMDLFVASLGKLSWFHFSEGKYMLKMQIECAVRHLILDADSNLIACMKDKVISYEINDDSMQMDEKSCLNAECSIHRIAIDFKGKNILIVPQRDEDPMRFYKFP